MTSWTDEREGQKANGKMWKDEKVGQKDGGKRWRYVRIGEIIERNTKEERDDEKRELDIKRGG